MNLVQKVKDWYEKIVLTGVANRYFIKVIPTTVFRPPNDRVDLSGDIPVYKWYRPDKYQRGFEKITINPPITLNKTINDRRELLDEEVEILNADKAETRALLDNLFNSGEPCEVQNTVYNESLFNHLKDHLPDPYYFAREWGQNSSGATVPWRDNKINIFLGQSIFSGPAPIEPGNYTYLQWSDTGSGMDEHSVYNDFLQLFSSQFEFMDEAEGEFGIGGGVSPFAMQPKYEIIETLSDNRNPFGVVIDDNIQKYPFNSNKIEFGTDLSLLWSPDFDLDIEKLKSVAVDFLKYLDTPIYLHMNNKIQELTRPFKPSDELEFSNTHAFNSGNVEGFLEYRPGDGSGIEVLSRRIKLDEIPDSDFSGAINYIPGLPKTLSRNVISDVKIKDLIEEIVDAEKQNFFRKRNSYLREKNAYKTLDLGVKTRDLDRLCRQVIEDPMLIPEPQLENLVAEHSKSRWPSKLQNILVKSSFTGATLSVIPQIGIRVLKLQPHQSFDIELLENIYWGSVAVCLGGYTTFILSLLIPEIPGAIKRKIADFYLEPDSFIKSVKKRFVQTLITLGVFTAALCTTSYAVSISIQNSLREDMNYVEETGIQQRDPFSEKLRQLLSPFTNIKDDFSTSYKPGPDYYSKLGYRLRPSTIPGNSFNPADPEGYFSDKFFTTYLDNRWHTKDSFWRISHPEPGSQEFIDYYTQWQDNNPILIAEVLEIMDLADTRDEKVRMAESWIKNNFVYSMRDEGYSLDEWLITKNVKCDSANTVLAYILRTDGIPARFVTGVMGGPEQIGYHGWVNYYDEEWKWADATPYTLIEGETFYELAVSDSNINYNYLIIGALSVSALAGGLYFSSKRKKYDEISPDKLVSEIYMNEDLQIYLRGEKPISELPSIEHTVLSNIAYDSAHFNLHNMVTSPYKFVTSDKKTHMDDIQRDRGKTILDMTDSAVEELVDALSYYGVKFNDSMTEYVPDELNRDLTFDEEEFLKTTNKIVESLGLNVDAQLAVFYDNTPYILEPSGSKTLLLNPVIINGNPRTEIAPVLADVIRQLNLKDKGNLYSKLVIYTLAD